MTANNIQFTKIEIQIAKYLFKHYKDRYNARQLARILNINHAHTNTLCNFLVDKELLVKEKLGNAVYFSYDYKKKLALHFMEYLLSLEEKEFPKWLTVPLHSLKKFKPYLQLGLVFGSSVHIKDFHDIDVLLVYDAHTSKEIAKIKEEIRKSQLVEQPIRYVDLLEKDILKNKEDKIFYNIISDNLVFHNPLKYVEVVRKCHR